jgi:hypothetical protein
VGLTLTLTPTVNPNPHPILTLTLTLPHLNPNPNPNPISLTLIIGFESWADKPENNPETGAVAKKKFGSRNALDYDPGQPGDDTVASFPMQLEDAQAEIVDMVQNALNIYTEMLPGPC